MKKISLSLFFIPPGRLNRKEEGRKLRQQLYKPTGLPWWFSVKELPAKAGDVDSISGLERSPGRGHINPLQFLPGKSHGEKSLAGYSPWGHKDLDMTEHTGIQAYIPERRREGEEEKMEGGRRKKEGKGGREGRKKGRRDEKEDEKRQMFKCCNRSKEMKRHGHL